MYITFIIILMIMLFLNYIMFKGDFMEPPVFLSAIFLFSAILATYLYEFWNLENYGGYTVFLFMLGIGSFSIGAYLAKRIVFVKNDKKPVTNNTSIIWGRIDIYKPIIIGIVLFTVVTFTYFLYFFISTVSLSSIASMITDFKNIRTSEEMRMPTILSALIKIVGLMSNISLFILLNNILVHERKKRDFGFVIIICVYLIISFLSANRGEMLMLCLAGVMAWYIIYSRLHGWRQKNTEVILSKGIKVGIIFLLLFWFIMYITGGTKEHSGNKDIILYFCGYISSPLAGFDLYLKQGGLPCNWFGEETFVTLNNNLSSMFNISTSSSRYLEFRYTDQYSVTNIYSSFRRFYHDFGIVGVIVLSFIQGYLTEKLYKHVKKKRNYKTTVDFSMCLYSYLFYTVLYILIDELFYSSNISFSGVFKVILLYIGYKIIFYKYSQTYYVKEKI